MFEIKGKYNSATVFAKEAEETAFAQILDICNQEFLKDSKIRMMPDCLTQDTEVLTDKGFVKITELNENAMVANYIPENGKISFSKVKNIIIRDKREDEKVFEFFNKQSGLSIKVSENHRMAIKNDMGILAKDIHETLLGDIVLSGNGLVSSQISKKYTDDELRMISWIVGDGNIKITKNKKTNNYRIRFGFKKERKINRVIELIKKMDLGHSVDVTSKQTTIMINTKSSKGLLEKIDYKKEFPNDFIFLSPRQTSVFFDEMIMIDGDFEAHLKKRGYRLNAKSESNLNIPQILASINGRFSKLVKRIVKNNFNNTEIDMCYLNLTEESKMKESRSGTASRLVQRNEIDYDGKLVCIECESSFFIAKQGGMTFVTGNCHAGKGCTVGTTMTVTDKIVPNFVGVDIGCGVLVTKINKSKDEIDFQKLDDVINANVPSGMSARSKAHPFAKKVRFDKVKAPFNLDRAEKSIGTLGGGNHFISLEEHDGDVYILIHSGSRNLGKQVAEHYQEVAYKSLSSQTDEMNLIIEKLKAEGRSKDIQKTIAKMKSERTVVRKELAYVTGSDMDDYLNDLGIAQEYAALNRKAMVDEIVRNMGWNVEEQFDTIHNYVDLKHKILRKGAISAQKGEKVVIPINMRDGSIIAIGKGNENWNFSGPHGAGRIMSRSKAKQEVTLEEFEESMKGIWSTSVVQSTVDESPFAYKPMDEIMENIQDSLDIQYVVKPIYNFKSK